MIRFAASHDVGRLVEMGRRFHASSIYADRVKFDADAVGASLEMFIQSSIGLVKVVERAGEIQGAIGGVVAPHFVAGVTAASELFWWVEPEHRGAGMGLLTAYEDEAAHRGARYSGMICPFGNGSVEKIYAKSGYSPLETIHFKELA
jgi:GNAT superfamily N-acetyltransferase